MLNLEQLLVQNFIKRVLLYFDLLIMSQYKKLFQSCRIKITSPNLNRSPEEIIFIVIIILLIWNGKGFWGFIELLPNWIISLIFYWLNFGWVYIQKFTSNIYEGVEISTIFWTIVPCVLCWVRKWIKRSVWERSMVETSVCSNKEGFNELGFFFYFL